MSEQRIIKLSPNLPSSWTFITVTYNSAVTLRTFWHEFHRNEAVEWIVVDNASNDSSAEQAEALGAKVIRLAENVGFGAANNIGFHNSKSRYVAFVNPDVAPDITGLPLLEAHIRDHPLDLVSPQLINPDGSLQPNGRGLPYLLSKIQNRIRKSIISDSYLRYAKPGESIKVEWLMGAVVAASRKRLEELGPWDERFFVYYEDADLGLRNSQLLGDSVVIGDIRWRHGWARETNKTSWKAWKAWKLEIPSLIKFYTRYIHLLRVPSTRNIMKDSTDKESQLL